MKCAKKKIQISQCVCEAVKLFLITQVCDQKKIKIELKFKYSDDKNFLI